MGASLIAAHLHSGVAFADNTTHVESMLPLLSSAGHTIAWRLRGTSGATIDQLKTYASANTTLVSTTITARKNGSSQSLSVSYGSGETGEKQDTSNSFAVSDGDDVDVEVVVANDISGSKSITVHSISLRCTPDDAGDTVCRVGAVTSSTAVSFNTASVTRYFGTGPLVFSANEYPVDVLSDWESSHLHVQVAANARTTTTTFRTRKNGANGAQSVSYGNGETGQKEDTSHTDSLTIGDTWSLSMTTGTGSQNMTVAGATVALKSAAGEYECICGENAALTNSTSYCSLVSGISASQPNESKAQVRGGEATYKNLRARVSANTHATGSSTITMRVEGADSALSVSYAFGETGTKSDTDTVAVADDDRLGHKIISSGGGTLTLRWIAVTGVTSIGLSPASIASTTALGTPSFTETIAPTGVASTLAVGTPNIDLIPDGGGSSIDVSPIGIDSTASVGTPALSLATISPASVVSTLALGVAAIAAISIAPTGIASTAACGTPAISLSVAATGIVSTATCGAPSLALSIAPSGVASTAAVGVPTLALDALSPVGIASAAALGTPALVVTIAPAGVASTATCGAPALALATCSPVGVDSTIAVGVPALAIAVSATGIDSTAAAGTPSIAIAIAPASIASTVSVGTAHVRIVVIVRIYLYPSFRRATSLAARFPRAAELAAEFKRALSVTARMKP